MNIYTDFFHILNNDRYHMRLLMSESEHLSSRYSCTVKITIYFWRIYLHICQVFFQVQSSCTLLTCMHFLLIISLVIALIPEFHANYTVHHIKKGCNQLSWIFWLRIKEDVETNCPKRPEEQIRPSGLHDHGESTLISCWPESDGNPL